MAATFSELQGRSSERRNSSNCITNNFILLITITFVFYVANYLIALQVLSIDNVYKPIWLIKTLTCAWAGFQLMLFTVVKLQRRSNASQRAFAGGLLHKARHSFLMELRNIILLFLLYIASCIVFHIISILYGAYVFENVEETFVFSVLLSTFVSLPCLFVNELNQDAWNRVISGNTSPGVESYVVIVACCSLLGAWLGAIPIPLDWDRPWQVWPISCSVGGVVGHGTGLLLCTIHSGFKQLQQYRRGKTKLF